MPRKAAAPTTYREAYAALSRVAAELESGEADLDRVLPLIEEARAAYDVCRERIEAVRAALGEGAGDSPLTGEPGDEDGEADEEEDSDGSY